MFWDHEPMACVHYTREELEIMKLYLLNLEE